MTFEFDPAKSAVNRDKHGIDFEGAKALWTDGRALTIRARDGVDGEPRWLSIGEIDGKLWSSVITYRDGNIRLISVRRSRDDEVDLYGRQDL